jgi:universal stress protein A
MIKVSRILAPADFSSGSTVSVEYAAALAHTLHSTVTLFHVYQVPDLMRAIVPGADHAVDAERERALAQDWLENLRVETRKHLNIEMRVVVVHGSSADEIISFSRTGEFDMVVMGTHGRTGLRHVLMGSVAEEVVRRAHCPVLTIHLPFPHSASRADPAHSESGRSRS